MKHITKYLLAAVFALCATTATAVDRNDAGVVTVPDTELQGFAAVYVPETGAMAESLVYYWFTHSADGYQLWFVTDPVPVGEPNVTVNLYKPISTFMGTRGSMENPVGKIQFLDFYGDRILVQFGLLGLKGLPEECGPPTNPVLPSPEPPEIEGPRESDVLPDEWPCKGRMWLERVSPRPFGTAE